MYYEHDGIACFLRILLMKSNILHSLKCLWNYKEENKTQVFHCLVQNGRLDLLEFVVFLIISPLSWRIFYDLAPLRGIYTFFPKIIDPFIMGCTSPL